MIEEYVCILAAMSGRLWFTPGQNTELSQVVCTKLHMVNVDKGKTGVEVKIRSEHGKE